MTESLVSLIVLPAEGAPFSHKILERIACQDYRPLEVIWVGDPPRQADVEDVPLHVVAREETSGLSLRKGLSLSRGEYVGFLEGTVFLEPNHISLLVACLEESGSELAFSDYEYCDLKFDAVKRRFLEHGAGRVFQATHWFVPLLEGTNVLPCSLIRRGAAERVGFDGALDRLSGWDMAMTLMRHAPFHHVPEVTVKVVGGDFPDAEFERVVEKHRSMITGADILNYRCILEGRRKDLQSALEAGHEARRLAEEMAEVQKVLPPLQREHLRIHQMEQLVAALRHHKDALDQELSAIKSSRAWRYVQRYGRLRALMKEPGRWRRGLQVLKNEGLSGVRRRLQRVAPPKAMVQPRHDFPQVDEREVSLEAVGHLLNVPVTIIIPTRDAGDAFPGLLKHLRTQWGVAPVEIMVIDSGSRDETVAHARMLADKVLEIPPQDFHHGKTRMLGARHAQGDILVFSVQDALPVGHDWLYRLIRPIAEEQADAVSTLQIPPSGADLFACWSTWGMRRHLAIEGNWLRSGSTPDWKKLAKSALRRFIHLDNVSLAIPRELLLTFPFERSYAEDLQLGWRLLEAGHRLLFQTDNAVIHAHTRPPAYFFRRAYVDHRALAEVLGIPLGRREPDDVEASVASAYRRFSAALAQWEGGWDRQGLVEFIEALRIALRAGEEIRGDEGLSSIFDTFPKRPPVFSLMIAFERILYGHLYSFAEYLGVVRGREGPEVSQALHKLFAMSAGGFVADYGLHLEASLLGNI